jgi:hypothetical protein
MSRKLSALYVIVTALVIVFQIAVIAGAPLGAFTQGGANQGALGDSGKVVAAISIGILLLCAAVTFRYGSALPTAKNSKWLRVAFSAVFALNFLEFVLNWITPSVSERLIWGPVNTLLFGTVVAIALKKRQGRRNDKTL